jgi:monofunctional glycosyltransferase
MAPRHAQRTFWRWLRNKLLHASLWVVLATAVLVLPFRWINPPITMFMATDRLHAAIARDRSYRFRHQWVAWHDMSANIKIAVIAAEDQRFDTHFGFDLIEIDKALEARQVGGAGRGASTISQQTAKNLFLWSGHSWIRKGLEAWLTLWIEACWPKNRILEVYLNSAEFGPGVFGAGAASDYFFGRTPNQLSVSESALLAAVLPNPIRFSVAAPSAKVRQRQQWIKRQIRSLGGASYLQLLDTQ